MTRGPYRRSGTGSRPGYEQMKESMALLKMLGLGNRQIEAGQVQPATEATSGAP